MDRQNKCEGSSLSCRNIALKEQSSSSREHAEAKKLFFLGSKVEQKYDSTTEPSDEMLNTVKKAHEKRGEVVVKVTKTVKTSITTTDTPAGLKSKLETKYVGSEVTVVESRRRRLAAKSYDVTIDNLPKTTSTAGFVDEVQAVLPAGSTASAPTVKFVTTVTTTLKEGTTPEQAAKDAKADLKTIEEDASAGFTSGGEPKVTKGDNAIVGDGRTSASALTMVLTLVLGCFML